MSKIGLSSALALKIRLEMKKLLEKIIKKKKNTFFFNYAFSKYLFTRACLKIARENQVKCRVLKLFHVYGGNENKKRLWIALLNAAKKQRFSYDKRRSN